MEGMRCIHRSLTMCIDAPLANLFRCQSNAMAKSDLQKISQASEVFTYCNWKRIVGDLGQYLFTGNQSLDLLYHFEVESSPVSTISYVLYVDFVTHNEVNQSKKALVDSQEERHFGGVETACFRASGKKRGIHGWLNWQDDEGSSKVCETAADQSKRGRDPRSDSLEFAMGVEWFCLSVSDGDDKSENTKDSRPGWFPSPICLCKTLTLGAQFHGHAGHCTSSWSCVTPPPFWPGDR